MDIIKLRMMDEVHGERQFKAAVLDTIPELEHFESYLMLKDGSIISGKGGNFKRLRCINGDTYILSYQRPFQKSVQEHFTKRELVARFKENKATVRMVTVLVY